MSKVTIIYLLSSVWVRHEHACQPKLSSSAFSGTKSDFFFSLLLLFFSSQVVQKRFFMLDLHKDLEMHFLFRFLGGWGWGWSKDSWIIFRQQKTTRKRNSLSFFNLTPFPSSPSSASPGIWFLCIHRTEQQLFFFSLLSYLFLLPPLLSLYCWPMDAVSLSQSQQPQLLALP